MMFSTKTAKRIFADHESYWDDLRPRMRKLQKAYRTEYWHRGKRSETGQIIIETSRAYEFIEGYIASLFSRNPSVIVKGDVRGRGDSIKAQSLTNQFLLSIRSQVEDASRLALIYPASFLKMSPVDHKDVFKRVRVTPVAPWDVLVDDKADSWDAQRFVGHRYWVSLHEAKERWGNKKYSGVAKTDWMNEIDLDSTKIAEAEADPFDQFIEVVEFYDVQDDRLLIWSSHYSNGDKWLFDGVTIEKADGKTETIRTIPFRDADDGHILPIIPLFYSRLPEEPTRGYSALHRIYDQIQEVNISRTFQANAVRKASRQWVVEKGILDSEGMAKIALGQDGEFIEVELSPGQTLAGTIQPVPHTPTPPEIEAYINQVQNDLDRGSVMAPFTRGQPSNRATATEITALASYSHSEVGRLARARDAAIEKIAETYVSMVAMYMGEEPDIVVLSGKAEVLRGSDLQADFAFFAQDSGSTPITEQQKKGELLGSIAMLVELGVPSDALRKEVVRLLELPESFNEPQPAPGPAGAQLPPGTPQPAPETAANDLGLGPGQIPSPERISQVLPS